MRIDIAERKKVELELRETRDELERRVEERTEELNTELKMRKEAEAKTELERQRPRDAVNSFKGGFALYDAEDKLVICNDNYLAVMNDVRDILRPGIKFEEMLRVHAKRSLRKDGIIRDEAYIQSRMTQHLNPIGPLERSYEDGRISQVHEFKTQDGGIAVIRVDAMEFKNSEKALRQTQERLSTEIESLNERFTYYDADDCFVTYNKHYTDHHAHMGDALKPEARWEDLIREMTVRGLIPVANGRENDYICERMALHRKFKEPYVSQRLDGT